MAIKHDDWMEVPRPEVVLSLNACCWGNYSVGGLPLCPAYVASRGHLVCQRRIQNAEIDAPFVV